MNILLAEYTISHNPDLAPEGRAMLKVLTDSFNRIGYQVCSPNPGSDFGEEIKRLSKICGDGLVIAPDDKLAIFTKMLEDNTRNMGCNSLSIAMCANKRRTADILKAHGIDVPMEISGGTRVIKRISGSGALNMRITDEEPSDDEFGQEFIEGEHLSVSLIGSRVVGETCLYYTGNEPLLLAVNKQNIIFGPDGTVSYIGGETPADHPKKDILYKIAVKALKILGCQGYIGVDMIVSDDRIVVVDVNPRPTTSITGIAACMKEEIGKLILDASYGKAPDMVHLTGHAKYFTNGKVQYDRD